MENRVTRGPESKGSGGRNAETTPGFFMKRDKTMIKIDVNGITVLVYHRDEAGCPEAHNSEGGPYYYEPEDRGPNNGEVFSIGFPTELAAIKAAAEESAFWEEWRDNND